MKRYIGLFTGLTVLAITISALDSFIDLACKARIRWFTKTSGFHEIRPVLKLDMTKVVAKGTLLDKVDLSKFDEIRETGPYLEAVGNEGTVPSVPAFQYFLRIAAAAGYSFFAFAKKMPSAIISGVQPSLVLAFTSAP